MKRSVGAVIFGVVALALAGCGGGGSSSASGSAAYAKFQVTADAECKAANEVTEEQEKAMDAIKAEHELDGKLAFANSAEAQKFLMEASRHLEEVDALILGTSEELSELKPPEHADEFHAFLTRVRGASPYAERMEKALESMDRQVVEESVERIRLVLQKAKGEADSLGLKQCGLLMMES
jgi:hypothetical protein